MHKFSLSIDIYHVKSRKVTGNKTIIQPICIELDVKIWLVVMQKKFDAECIGKL